MAVAALFPEEDHALRDASAAGGAAVCADDGTSDVDVGNAIDLAELCAQVAELRHFAREVPRLQAELASWRSQKQRVVSVSSSCLLDDAGASLAFTGAYPPDATVVAGVAREDLAGSPVDAKYLCWDGSVTDEWYPGHVRHLNEDGTCWIDFDEGGYWWCAAPPHLVRRRECAIIASDAVVVESVADVETLDARTVEATSGELTASDSPLDAQVVALDVPAVDAARVDGVGACQLPEKYAEGSQTSEVAQKSATQDVIIEEPPLQEASLETLQLQLRPKIAARWGKSMRPASATNGVQRDIALPTWLAQARPRPTSSGSVAVGRPRPCSSASRVSRASSKASRPCSAVSRPAQRIRPSSSAGAFSRIEPRPLDRRDDATLVSITNLPKPACSNVDPAAYYANLLLPPLKSLTKSASCSQLLGVRRSWCPSEGAYHLEVSDVELGRSIVRITHGVKIFGKRLKASLQEAYASDVCAGGDTAVADDTGSSVVPDEGVAAIAAVVADGLVALPAGWERVVDPASGHCYYCNRSTGESKWELPVQSDEGDVAEVPAALAEPEPDPEQVPAGVDLTPRRDPEANLPHEPNSDGSMPEAQLHVGA